MTDTKKQISNMRLALLHIAKKELGLSDDEYRGILQASAGVTSGQDLTIEQFNIVMDRFSEMGFTGDPQKTGSRGKPQLSNFAQYKQHWVSEFGPERPSNMATPNQLAMIETQWGRMSWYWNSTGAGDKTRSLKGMIKKRFGVDGLRFMSFSQAHKTVEGLKAMTDRHEKQAKKDKKRGAQ